MSVLVTGFEPFGERSVNTSGHVSELAPALLDGVTCGVLPVDRAAAPARLRELVAERRPSAVLLLGEARGVQGLRLERVAHNRYQDATCSTALDPSGPERLVVTTPLPVLHDAVRRSGVDVSVSDDAGRFVCNAVLFHALRELTVPVGFVHLPALEGGDGLSALVRGVVAALGCLVLPATASTR